MACNYFQLYHGDAYDIIFALELNGAPMPVDNVELIEFVVGDLRKVYPTEVTRDDNDYFHFPVTQEETFAMPDEVEYQVRIKYQNATVRALAAHTINVKEVLSNHVL